jgi:hypothetical protein
LDDHPHKLGPGLTNPKSQTPPSLSPPTKNLREGRLIPLKDRLPPLKTERQSKRLGLAGRLTEGCKDGLGLTNFMWTFLEWIVGCVSLKGEEGELTKVLL